MASLFSPFQVRVDPWQADYGSETPLTPLEEEPKDPPDPNVELPAAEWRPIRPRPAELPRRLYFVDGVRRLESRLQVRHNGGFLHAAFGSYAVGCVHVADRTASFGESQPGRLLVYGSGHKPSQDVTIRSHWQYCADSASDHEPDAPLRLILNRMRQAEGQLVRRLSDAVDTLVICDGPLSFEETGRGLAIGFIKRITQLYLPPELMPVVAALPAGCRTPLFAIRAKYPRYSWYLRLAAVRPSESDFHGLARLEVTEPVGKDVAVLLANATVLALPTFAPPRARDPRSPQNLLPIGALESRLRRELGDCAIAAALDRRTRHPGGEPCLRLQQIPWASSWARRSPPARILDRRPATISSCSSTTWSWSKPPFQEAGR